MTMGDRIPVETRGGETEGDWQVAEPAARKAAALAEFTEAFQVGETCGTSE